MKTNNGSKKKIIENSLRLIKLPKSYASLMLPRTLGIKAENAPQPIIVPTNVSLKISLNTIFSFIELYYEVCISLLDFLIK